MENELIICYFCDESYHNNSCYISNYNDIIICNNCSEFNYTKHKQIIMINNIECHVCFENKKGIELPNCNHIICIDCYKSIYFGYNNSPRPKHFRELSDPPEFPYTINDDIENDDGRLKLDEYMDWEHMNLNYEKEYEELIQERDNMKNVRPQWMNDELFIIYENNNIKYWISDYKIEDEYDKWLKNKKDNIKNKLCPLCRK